MPTNSTASADRVFDAEASRHASLTATLSRVRFRRRARRTVQSTAALLLATAAVWLAIPSPSLRPDPPLVQNPLLIRSSPLTAEQRIVSAAGPELFIRTPAESDIAMRITTPTDAAVPRLGEDEFHRWLAAHEVYCIQLNGGPPRVLPLDHR